MRAARARVRYYLAVNGMEVGGTAGIELVQAAGGRWRWRFYLAKRFQFFLYRAHLRRRSRKRISDTVNDIRDQVHRKAAAETSAFRPGRSSTRDLPIKGLPCLRLRGKMEMRETSLPIPHLSDRRAAEASRAGVWRGAVCLQLGAPFA